MKQDTHLVRLKLSGPKITSEKFVRGVSSFLGMVSDVSSKVAKNRNAVSWVISVESGSDIIVAEPLPVKESDAEFIPSILKTIKSAADSLERGSEPPEDFPESSLEKMRDLASILGGKDHEIESVKIIIGDVPVNISHHTTASVDDILGAKSEAFGTIEGKLEMVTLRGGYMAVYDDLTDRRVKCIFKSDLLEEIKPALGKRVSVYGLVSYRQDGIPVSIRIQDFRILSKDDLPTFEDVRGILGDG